MRETSGSGRVLRDLGLIEHFDDQIDGVIGGAGQPSTLLVVFRTSSAFDVTALRQPLRPFTDRFIAVGLRHQDGDIIPLDDQGRPVRQGSGAPPDEAGDRLPPGGYIVSISTSQWQQAPFRLRLAIAATGSLQVALAGSGQLAAGFRITRLASALNGRGGLGLEPSRLRELHLQAAGRARLWAGLVSVPTYQEDPAPGLPHAWLMDSGTAVQVGSGDGLAWQTLATPAITEYVSTALSLDDFRGGLQRLVFSSNAANVYATYQDLGPLPSDVTGAMAPDYPTRFFQSLVQGAHVRRCSFSLPINGATQLVVLLREELRWNNDIIRDVDISNPDLPRYAAVNARPVSAHRRLLQVLVVTSSRVRVLRQPPAALRVALDEVLPPLNTMLQSVRLQVPGQRYGRAAVDCLLPSFALTGEAPSEGDRIFGADPAEAYGNLLISYGLTWSMQARQGFTSAAIYDLLRDYAAIRGQADYNRRSYSFVLRNLANRPPGLPQYSPWFADGGYAQAGAPGSVYAASREGRLRYGQWRGEFPADASNQLNLAGEKWSPVNIEQVLPAARANSGSTPQLLLAYDWERPGYCRTSLGELGFSSGDLSTAETAWRALLSLNHGDTGLLKARGGLGRSTLRSQRTQRVATTLQATGTIGASRPAKSLFRVLSGRGALGVQLVTAPNGNYIPLYSNLRGAGALTGQSLLRKPLVYMTARVQLGRPTLLAGKIIIGTPAALAWVGASAGLAHDKRLQAQSAAFQAAGGDAQIRVSDYVLQGQTAAFDTTGQVAELAYESATYFNSWSAQQFGWSVDVSIDWWGS